MGNVQNCPGCGKIFVRSLREVCQDCFKKEEADFQTVYQFIRKKENRMASREEVEEVTGVKGEVITKFIKKGRLHLQAFPNLTYPCESCGKAIREGRICEACKANITKGLGRIESEKNFVSRKRKEENSKLTTYHSLNNDIDKKG
jgi:flagellar operon protein (TIGR03826 family)